MDPSRPLGRSGSSHVHSKSMCCLKFSPAGALAGELPPLTDCLLRPRLRDVRVLLPPREVGAVPLISHFTEEETDSETLRSMPKVTQLVNGSGGVWTRSQSTHSAAAWMCLPVQMLATALEVG